MNETIHTPRSSKLEDAPYMLTNPHSRTRKANWQRVPPSDRWFSGSPCWSCVVFTWLSFPQRRRLDPMLRDHCLSLLTLNLSPPHATIATCLWYGRRSQQYACKRQDAVVASDSFGFITCTRHHPWSDITSRNNNNLPTIQRNAAVVHTEAHDDSD
jgi:hypothetical protein